MIAALARCRPSRHRGSGARARAGRTPPDPHVPGHVRPAPRAQAAPRRARRASSRSSSGVRCARQHTDDVEFSAEDATRSDLDFLCRVVEAAIREGATTINLPDTVGYATPDRPPRVLRGDHRRRVPNADRAVFSTHCHDDLGLAVANSLAAFDGGVRQVECTINGIGERAGNASLEEIVMALRVRHDRLPLRHRHSLGAAVPTRASCSRSVDRRTRAGEQGHRRAQRVRARGGHPPGRHAEGLAGRTRSCGPRTSARPPSNSCSAGHSGRHAVQRRCEILGLVLTSDELGQVYHAVISMGEHRKIDRRRRSETHGRAACAAEVRRAPPVARMPRRSVTATESNLTFEIADVQIADCRFELQIVPINLNSI